AVDDEVHVQRVPERRRDEIRERVLELLVVEAREGEAERTVGPDAGEDAPDVSVDREDQPAERVHHHAVRALPVNLGQAAEECLQLLIGPPACGVERAGTEALPDRPERAEDTRGLLAPQAARREELLDLGGARGEEVVPARKARLQGLEGTLVRVLARLSRE